MIHFAWPWALVLLPLPWLIHRLAPPAPVAEEAALWVPSLDPFAPVRHELGRRGRSRFLLLAALLGWLLLLVASARPQWLGAPVELPRSGRDLVLAVDISGSMQTEDFRLGDRTVDRLTALKAVAGDFIDQRVGDRLGLILFGEQAYVQTPLTFDRQTLKQLLDEAVIGLAGNKTAIGDAIGLAVKRLKPEEGRQRVLILLTDGANTAGRIPPLKAAELAAGQGLKIYTIGLGADTMEVPSLFFSRTVNPSADLDEETLTEIAAKTGGRYFRARDTEALAEIYSLLDRLEPVEHEKDIYRPVTELYVWPLGLSLGLAVLLIVLQTVPALRRSA
ncbi:von Willebrand factor type A domain-containing protein [Desulfuromonas soudanensis]|uniref:von Willebrand factor type A domain-containing protein n=1 Tax=Desulfuromonas soudanensis TaxID=1603606 RepID=A0A0M4D6K2_9BACT|nr:VWA domain-containing protein [Desulfuromonas soudanensis]ALC14942.1 von Willebrand factor type A domain-containing protein [Desulfuromonas soudanensis]